MARRRVPARGGRGRDALMALYGDITARERAQDQARLQHELNAQLARLQNELQTARMTQQEGINTEQQLLGRALSSPLEAERIVGPRAMLGGVDTSSLVPTEQERLVPAYKDIGAAETQTEVPSIESLVAGHGRVGAPTLSTLEPGMTEADAQPPQLGPLTGVLQARSSRLEDIGQMQDAEMGRAGATSFLESQQTRLGAEAADAASFPAGLQRELEQQNVLGAAKGAQDRAQFQAMTPLEVTRTRAQEQAKVEVEQSAADTAGLIAVASSTPITQSLIETIVGPQGMDPTSGRPYVQDRYALAALDPNTGVRASRAFKDAFGPYKGLARGYLDPNVLARIERLTSQQTTQALQDLRKQVSTGASPMGQASDRDVQIVQNGVTQLESFRMDPAAAEAELKRIYDAAIRLQQRAIAAQETLSGAGRLPPAIGLQPTPQTPKPPPSAVGQSLRTSSGRSFTVKQ